MLCFYAFASVKQLLLLCATGIGVAVTAPVLKIILINFVVATIAYKTIVYSQFLALSLLFKCRGRIYFIAFILFDLKLHTQTHTHATTIHSPAHITGYEFAP